MVSFMDKLKKGMGVEEPKEESSEKKEMPELAIKIEPKKAKTTRKKIKKLEMRTASIESLDEKPKKREGTPKEEKGDESKVSSSSSASKESSEKEEKIYIKEEKTIEELPLNPDEDDLTGPEGELAIDVYQTDNDLVIQSAVAGVNSQSVDICLEKDILTIKGCRRKSAEERSDYFSQECFWGPFSREIILPAEVDPDKVLASMRDGILTIRIPKILREKKRKIIISA